MVFQVHVCHDPAGRRGALQGLVVPDFVRIPGPEACYGAKTVVEAHNACAGDPYFPFVAWRHGEGLGFF